MAALLDILIGPRERCPRFRLRVFSEPRWGRANEAGATGWDLARVTKYA
jgi:hypothetical protein